MIRRLATVLLLAIATSMLFAAENAKKNINEFSTLADFTGSANGAEPLYGYPIVFSGGNGYGMTNAGGTYDEGVVFQVTTGGTVTTLYTFCSQVNCTDGAEPFSGPLVVGGNIYGTTYWGGLYGRGTVFELTLAGQLTTLYSFCSQPGCTDGGSPIAGLVQVGGNFYGTTQLGGANGQGSIFEITPAGQLTTLYSFCSQSGCADGAVPFAGLVQATNGNLYGTTVDGGTNGAGTIFEITPAGQLTTLYSFCSQSGCADGAVPYAGLVQATNGNLYGTTVDGGVNGDFGTVFEITPAGQLTTLHGFAYTDGAFPYAGLIQASDGNLYGTTEQGGTTGYGTAFGITPGGQLSTVHSFALTDGAFPYGGLVQDASGNLYGTTYFGGTQYNGTIFSLPVGLDRLPERQTSSRKTEANINTHRPDLTGANDLGLGGKAAADFFSRRPDLPGAAGVRLSGEVAVVPGLPGTKVRIPELAGAVAGPMRMTTAPAGKTKSKAKSSGQSLSTLLNFDGANGAFPYFTSLIQGTDGNLYGTTESGGTFDQGYIFKVTPGGTLSQLYTFCSQANCTDGAEPFAGLVQATNGNFYGTTSEGGANGAAGTVFEVTSAGRLTTLYNFCSQSGCADGLEPYAGLIQGTDGNFYGTTLFGGANDLGTVFKITPGGTLTTLYSFCSQNGCTDGEVPYAGLVQGTDGNFYGTTVAGGANGAGTVFKITPGGTLTTLYSFCSQSGCTDGIQPEAGLVQGTDGNFYGTAAFGGANGEGTVFKITPGGTLTTLYSFCSQSGCTDGIQPEAGLVQAGGNFYGTTYFAGPNGYGTVFEITPAGQLTTLYGFGLTDGGFLEGGLVQANGNLYGMTVFGGSRLDGTIFSLPVAQQSLTLSCPTYTAQVGVAYSSALTASGGVSPYTFSIAGGSLPPGLTLNTSTGAITGTPTTAGVYNFVAQVVDSQSNTVTTNCGIAVSPIPLTLSCPTPMGQVGVLYSSALTGSGGVAPYTFSITNGSLPPGLTLNTSTGAITGTPTTAGTYNFTSQVVDSKGNTATASCSITINATLSCANNGNLNGNYAFLYQGWSNFSGSGYVLTATAGSLVFDGNGNITSGQYDQNDPVDGPSQGTLTGTYCVPANNVGTATINGSNGNTTTYAFVLQPNGNGNVIPYDTTTPWDASGVFLKQNTNDFSTSDFTGQYSLGFIGIDNADSRFGLAGAFTANGTANLINGELDGDDGGNYHNGTFSSDNFNVTPGGRGTVSLSVSGVGTGNFAFYVVNSSQVLIVQIDPISQGLQTLFSGQILQQQGLTYSDSDLNGVSVLGLQGLDTGCTPACADASLVFVTWNGSGSLSYSMDDNDGGTVQSSIGSGTYSVGSNGRVPISGTGNHNPIFYLTGKNAGFEVGSGGSKVQFGSMVAQSGSNFNNNSISGNYYGGSWELVSSSICGEVALLNVNSGNGNHTGESNCGESPRSETNSLTYTVSSDGRTVVTSNGLPNDIIYIVSPSSGGSGGSFISLPWEGNTNAKLVSFGVVPTTLTLGCPTGTAQVEVAYSSALVASGGVAPYTFSITSGSLPPGLTLNSSTGAITGTPTTAGTYNFTAQVVDSQGNTATSSCSIVVSSPTLTLSCPTGTAQVGFAYSSALTASGGVAPYTFSIISGSLPPGLTLNASTGAITGTPTT
ncbi:MAG: choice-of-anchor tandem repeat GloVer-containing protein, partial [Terriglobales bacterium]